MQVTSMLSAGYLEPMQNISRAKKPTDYDNATDQQKQRQEQQVLAEEQAIRAKLGGNAQVHTVYQYAIGTDGRRYITGASVSMTGSEEALNRVGGGPATEDMQSVSREFADTLREKSGEDERTRKTAKSESDKRDSEAKNDKAEDEKDAQIRELKQIQNEVIAHEAAHQAAAGEFGGGVSYEYTQGPDGKSYIVGGEVPIRMKEGATPEETLRNMQKVQAAANAPADPSGQDMKVAAKAAAIAAKARGEISRGDDDEQSQHKETVARGTPVFQSAEDSSNQQDPEKNGVQSLLATVKELQMMNMIPAA